MTYRIDLGGDRCFYVHSREELIRRLRILDGNVIEDIKRYKGGAVDSVLEQYRLYIKNEPAGSHRTGSDT